jgi:lambda family phage portal protein
VSILSNVKKAFGFGPPPTPAQQITIRPAAGGLNLPRTRIYEAAVPSELNYDWLAWSTSQSYEVLNAWRRVTNYARDLERSNPYVRAFLRELTNNVIGQTGIRLQARVPMQKGSNLNDKLNKQLSEAWEEFRQRGVYDSTGTYSGVQADELIMRAVVRDGGVLIRLLRGYPGNRFRFAIQLLEIDALDLYHNQIYEPDVRVTTGVETNSLGKPLAYWMYSNVQSDLWVNQIQTQRVRVPASQILHVFTKERITAVRGISWFASILQLSRMLAKYEEAVAVGQRMAASKMGFLETAPDAGQYQGQDTAPTGEKIEEVSPGAVIDLPVGKTFRPFDPGHGLDTYHDFRTNIVRAIGGALGINYNTLGNDAEKVNFSSSRYAREPEREFWRVNQRFFIEEVMQPIFAVWLECAVMAGALDIPFSQLDFIKKNIVWRPRGFSYINPREESAAAIDDISFGLSTRSHELAQRGLDFEETLEELKREKELIDKYQLVFVDPKGRNPYLGTEEIGSAAQMDVEEAEKKVPTPSQPAKGVKPIKPIAKSG